VLFLHLEVRTPSTLLGVAAECRGMDVFKEKLKAQADSLLRSRDGG
jgi:hypothetical protein